MEYLKQLHSVLIFGFILTTIIYLLYIQFSPGMGNIWYRNNEYFSPMGAVHVMVYPIYNQQMWYPNMWDINYFIWMLFYFAAILLLYR